MWYFYDSILGYFNVRYDFSLMKKKYACKFLNVFLLVIIYLPSQLLVVLWLGNIDRTIFITLIFCTKFVQFKICIILIYFHMYFLKMYILL